MMWLLSMFASLFIGVPLLLVSLVVGLVMTFLAFYQTRNWYRFKVSGCNIPSVRHRPLVGGFRFEEIHHGLERCQHMGTVFYTTLLHMPFVYISDPEMIQYIISKKNFPKSDVYNNIEIFWGRGLVSLQHGESHPWKFYRSLVDPAFKLNNIRAMNETFSYHVKLYTDILLKRAQTKELFDFSQDISKLTIDIISSAGFSYPLRTMDHNNSSDGFLKALQLLISKSGSPFLILPYGGHVLSYLYRDSIATLNKTLYSIIDQRIEEKNNGKRDLSAGKDLLDMLLIPDEEGKQLSKQDIRDQLFVFYLAGHETTASILSWTIYELARHPEVEEKLMEEIESVTGPLNEKIDPTLEQFESLPYLDMVLNEVMRFYPPTPSISRKTDETFEFKGFIFPKGVTIASSQYLMHRNPDYWPEPDKFDPERFSKEGSAGRPMHAYFPFSAGPRICIGKNFFYYEARNFLVRVLREIKFNLDPKHSSGVLVSSGGLIKPNAVWVTCEKRHKEE